MARTKEFDETEVLDKAVDLFWTKGYNATSANDLVETLGLSRSSLYSTYGDKRTLFIKSLERYRKKQVGAMLEMIEKSENTATVIAKMFELVIRQDVRSKVPKGCLMVSSAIELAPHDNEIAKIVQANENDIEETLKIAIDRGKERGDITSKHSSNSLAKFLYNTISGLRVASKSKVDESNLQEVVKLSLSVLN